MKIGECRRAGNYLALNQSLKIWKDEKLAVLRVVTLMLLSLTTACASSPSSLMLDASALIGRWQNRSGGFFRMSWDQCEFFRDQTFSCMSYPLKEDIALSYAGSWSLVENVLQLQLEYDQIYTYYIIESGRDSFTIDSRLSGVRTFYGVKEFK